MEIARGIDADRDSAGSAGRPARGARLGLRTPVADWLRSALLALALFALLLALTWSSGDLGEFLASEERWWEQRDARSVVLLTLVVAYLPLARRTVGRGGQANLAALRDALDWGPEGFDAALRRFPRASRRGAARAGAFGILCVPLTALLIDRDPSLYFQPGYWGGAQFWEFGIGGALGWALARLGYWITLDGRRFSTLAAEAREIDLLDPSALAPFARQGLLAALPGLILLSFLAFNLGDRGWLWAILVLGGTACVWTLAAVLLPMRGIHARIRRAKADELARVNAAIRGDASALAETAIAGRAHSGVGLADLIAYRRLVEEVPEWPLGRPLRARLVLYVALPLGSWLGGALVERLLDATLG
jgi:hypothetical protein